MDSWKECGGVHREEVQREILTHRGFQHFLAIYSAIKMTNASFKFYSHILLAIKFETVVVDKILHKIRPVV